MPTSTLIDTLTYSCYRHNRNLFPGISPARWKRVFDDVDVMEARYQDEEEMLGAPDEAWYEDLGHTKAHGQEIPPMAARVTEVVR